MSCVYNNSATALQHKYSREKKKKQKSRDRGIWTDTLLVQNRALYRWAKRKCINYLPSPGGQLWKIIARRVWLRRPFFRRRSRGLLCGWDLARSRGLGESGGARESQLFLGYVITGMFSKIHLDITLTTTTTEEYYIIRTKEYIFKDPKDVRVLYNIIRIYPKTKKHSALTE